VEQRGERQRTKSLNDREFLRGGGTKFRVKMASYVSLKGEIRNEYKIIVAVPEGKTAFRRHDRTWEDNIKICFDVAQDMTK
jgi:hypothetical protein